MKAALSFILLGITAIMAVPVYAADYYVATDGNDNWSGQQPNPTGADGPFRTIGRAIAAMGTGSIKTTYVRQGVYFQLGNSLTLTSQHNGVQLLAYQNESPVISGGFPVTNWQPEPSVSGAWSASLPAGASSVGVVTVNGEWFDNARTPNLDTSNPFRSGFFYVQKSLGPEVPDWQPSYSTDNAFLFRNNDLTPQIYANEPGAGIVIWDKLGWSSDPLPISSVDFVSKTVNLVNASQFGLNDTSRYFIYGTKGSLDIPGEYYFDVSANRLLIIPKNGADPNNLTVVVSTVNGDPIIRINGANQTRISGFWIRDQHNTGRWGVAQNGGIRIDLGDSNVIENNVISSVGIGIDLENATHTMIRENEIFDSVGSGVWFYGSNNSLLANYIHDIGLVEQAGRAVLAYTGSTPPAPNRIAYNLITDLPHQAIITGDGTTPANGLVIEYNDIRRTNQGSHDTGALYMKNAGNYTPSAREIVRYNTITDTGGLAIDKDLTQHYPSWSWGVYLDAGQSGTDVYGNLINISGAGGIFAHDGTDNNIINNISANGNGYQLVMQSSNNPLANVFQKNIFYYSIWAVPVLVQAQGQQGSLSNNIYWNSASGDYIFTHVGFVNYGDGTPSLMFPQWQATGADSGSLTVDPLFVNPAANDFHLQSNSPAFALGFEQLPFEQMGPQGYMRNRSKLNCWQAAALGKKAKKRCSCK